MKTVFHVSLKDVFTCLPSANKEEKWKQRCGLPTESCSFLFNSKFSFETSLTPPAAGGPGSLGWWVCLSLSLCRCCRIQNLSQIVFCPVLSWTQSKHSSKKMANREDKNFRTSLEWNLREWAKNYLVPLQVNNVRHLKAVKLNTHSFLHPPEKCWLQIWMSHLVGKQLQFTWPSYIWKQVVDHHWEGREEGTDPGEKRLGWPPGQDSSQEKWWLNGTSQTPFYFQQQLVF